jgi:hypothetical protein
MTPPLIAARRPRGVYVASFGIWLAALAVGMGGLTDYEARPGALADPPHDWPTGSALPHRPGLPTLVVFVHPRCPCSRATLSELNLVMNRLHGRLTASVVFMRPTDLPGSWTRTATWRRAREIPGVTVVADRDGLEARRFGAATSGQAVVYDRAGRLAFNGGITASRGHEGDSDGRRRLVSALADDGADPSTSRVFGCALFDARTSALERSTP